MPVTSWSTTASSNDVADSASGIIWSEGQAPATVNDSARSLMAVIKGDLANSLSANGYQKLPNGLIIQWGSAANGSVSQFAITFPIAFPTTCRQVVTSVGPVIAGEIVVATSNSLSTTTFAVDVRSTTGGSVAAAISRSVSWIAIGH